MRMLWALLRRDLLLAARQGGGAGTALGFFLAVLVLLPIGIGPDQLTLQRLAPGIIWITLLLSVLLSADRIFQQDFEDGSLDIMTLSPVSLELAAFTKAIAHWVSTSLPLSVAAPFLGILLNLKTETIWPLLLSTCLGSIGLSFIASIGASLTLNLRRGGLLISILILPLYVPILVFGMSACSGNPEIVLPSLLILSAIALASLVLAPIAAAAALRAYLK
jgi:heme exporter protein B